MIYVVFGVLAVFLLFLIVMFAMSLVEARRDSRVRELRFSKRKAAIATAALRKIANDAGSPVLEAQIALDDLDQLETKELN